jgi:TRAP-type C4-dicarboxylate transport system substrate-binding protein
MSMTRRMVLGGAAAGAGLLARPAILKAQAPKTLKLSHQFPGGTLEQGDFRDRICRKFAAEVEKRTNGALKVDVYPNSSLMKTLAQFSAVRKGALDLTLYPLAYAGGEIHETNIGLMPALVTNYDQAAKWKSAPIGQELAKILDDKGVVILTWVWQSGGIASRGQPLLGPEDMKGVKIRGGSREMDAVFLAAGAQVSTMPSNEVYIGMQTGALDAAVTSSTSLISFRLEELTKNLTSGRGRSYWFMLEPILIAKSTLQTLTPEQQKVVREVGADLEPFGTEAAKQDDAEVEKVYKAKGAQVHELTEEHIEKWRALARDTAWKDFAAKTKKAAELLKLAEATA